MLDYPPLDLKTSSLDKPRPKGAILPKMALFFYKCHVKPEQAVESHASPMYATKVELAGLPPALRGWTPCMMEADVLQKA
jgi:hypothetical protein